MSERRKILDMLAAGQVSADEADELLGALESDDTVRPRPPQRTAKLLRIDLDAQGESGEAAKILVNVPIGLAKFAAQLIPKDARGQLESQGIDLSSLVDSIEGDVPEGKLIELDSADEDGGRVRITIEVV